MNRWLSRLALSFFIIAAVLAWSALRALQAHLELWRVGMDLFAAAAAITLGVAGLRERHRGS